MKIFVKHTLCAQGYPIKIYVNINSTRMEFSTDMFVSDINSLKNDQISDTEKNHAVRNIRLNKIKSALEQMIILKDYESTDDFKKKASKIISGKEPRQRNKTFVDYLDEFVSLKNNKGTIALYNSTRKKLEAFDPKATLDSIDRVWLSRLEKELTETMSINGISIQLRNIRAVFNYAIDEGYTSNYPFRKFHIKQEKTPKRSLTLEQLRTLMEFDCEEFQKQYRDIFMLMLYLIGINAADLLNAKADDIDNQGRLNYHRAKTNRLYSIKVEPEAMEIINKYRGKNYLINALDKYKDYKDYLHHMNDALKSIGKRYRLGVKATGDSLFPGITSYWARHTWATLAYELDISHDIIGQALGHAESDTTDIYIRYDNKKVDEANRKIINHIRGIA